MSELLSDRLYDETARAAQDLGLSQFDGAHAASEVTAALTPASTVEDFTFDSERYDRGKHFSQLLTEDDSLDRFGEAISILSGYMVYTMRLSGEMRPALISGTLGEKPSLHINELLDDNMSEVGVQNQQLVLSGISQFGVESIGSKASHDRVAKVGAEAGHLLVAVSASLIPAFSAGIRNGKDIVHDIKVKGNVMNSVGKSVRGLTALPPVDATYSYESWKESGLRLVWPIINHFEKSGPLATDVPDAVQLANVHAYKTVKAARLGESAKRLIEQTVAS